MRYIQRKDPVFKTLETVDSFKTFREARIMLKEFLLRDRTAYYYISQKPCKHWSA